MKLTEKNLIALSKVAEEAALKAGKMIERVISSDPAREKLEVKNKETGSSIASQVVTEVDLESEKIILDIIKPTLKEFDLALLSEESIDDQSRFDKDYFWCIDPLDGTLAFTESKPGFSVSIALVSKKGVPQIGVVYDPSTQTLYSAVKGNGTFKNDQPFQEIEIFSKKEQNSLTVIAEPNLIKSVEFGKIIDELKRVSNVYGWSEIEIVEGRGAVINACQVIENCPAVYFKLPKPQQGGGSVWDFAATSCIFNELNGVVSDVFGNPLDLNKKGGTFMNRYGVIYASENNISTEMIRIIQVGFI